MAPYSVEKVETLVDAFEKSCAKQNAVKGSVVKLRSSERDLLKNAEDSRDLFMDAVKGDKNILKDVFGGVGLQRFHRFRTAMETVEMSDMHASDKRWDGLRDAMDTIEEVLKQLGIWKPIMIEVAPSSLHYGAKPRFAPGEQVKVQPEFEGGTPTMFSISPALPEGLEMSNTTGDITGELKPGVEVKEQKYTITASNNTGQARTIIEFSVKEPPPESVTYPGLASPYTIGEPLTLEPEVKGGAPNKWSVNSDLPKGLTLDAKTGVISGTPTELIPLKDFTITAQNSTGTVEAAVPLAVILAGPESLTYPGQREEYPHGQALHLVPALVMKSSKGQDPDLEKIIMLLNHVEYSIEPELPKGLVIIPSTGVITGAPLETRETTSYKVTAKNDGGEVSCNLDFAVKLDPPKGLSYPDMDVFFTGVPMSVSPTVEGLVEKWSVTPALPAGMQLDENMGIISGIPTETAPEGSSWTVSAINEQGSVEAEVKFCVKRPAPSDLQYPGVQAKYPVTRPVENTNPTYKGEVDEFSIAPALPDGFEFNTTTGEISGTPTAETDAATYTVTAKNETGSTETQITLGVAKLAPADLKYPEVDEDYTVGENLTLTPEIDGGATDWKVEPALPEGMTLDPATGVISGAPTAVVAEVSYVVTAANDEGSTSKVLTFSVHDPPPVGLYFLGAQEKYIPGEDMSITPELEAGMCTDFAVTPALPAGMAIDPKTGIISGAPAGPADMNTYVVTGSNPYGAVTAELAFECKVLAPDGLTYPGVQGIYMQGEGVMLEPELHAGACDSFTVSPALPEGLSIDEKTGIISGTAGAAEMATYEVTGTNPSGSTTCEITFECAAPEEEEKVKVPRARPKFERKKKEGDGDEGYATMLEGITDLDKLPVAPKRTDKMQWMLWMVHRAHLNDPTLSDFSFRDMKMPLPHIEPRIAPKLMNSLKTNKYITALDLGNSNIQKPQGEDLEGSMAVNTILTKLYLDNNTLDAAALVSVINGIAKNDKSSLQDFRFSNQKNIKVLGRSLEQAMGEMVAKNTTLTSTDLACTDPHWRYTLDKAMLRNVDLARKRRKRSSVTANALVMKSFEKIILRGVPEMKSWEIFSGEEQDKFLEVARRCTAKEKALPTNTSLAAFAKEEGKPLPTSEVAVVVKAFVSKFMGSFVGTKVTLIDDEKAESMGKLEVFSEKNERWNLNVWLDEGASCLFVSGDTPTVEISDDIAAWVAAHEE